MRKLRFFLSLLILFTYSLGTTWADSVKDTIALEGFGGSTSTSYVTSATSGSSNKGVGAIMNQWNPSTGQIKVNQGNTSSLNASNFSVYNTAAFSGAITKIEMVVTSGTVNNNYCQIATSSTAAISTNPTYDTDNAASGESTKSWSFGSSDDIRYFRISFAKNGGTVKVSYIIITYEGSSNTPSLSVEQNGSAVSALDFGDVKEDEHSDKYGYSAVQTIDVKGSNLSGNVKLEITEAGGGTFSIWREGATSTHEYIIAANEGAIDTSIVIAAHTRSTGLKEGNLQISSLASTADFTTLDIDLAINLKQLEDPTITFNNGNVETGYSVDLDTLFASNSPGEVTYTITSGSAYASLSGSILTGIAEGSVTIEANQAAASYFNAATATCTIGVTTHVITPGTYKFVPNTTFWGCGEINVNNAAANEINFVGSTNDIQVEIDNNSKANAYINASQTRVYDGYTMAFSVPAGFVITNITFTANGSNWAGAHTADVGEMTNNKNWAGNAHSVTITFAGTCRIDSIAVTYEAEPAILAPNILGENPFYPSTLITMNCGTDGATIYYTTNGNDPTSSDAVYSDTPIEITATTTFKAIAVNGVDVSDITERTFSKATVLTVAEALEAIDALNQGATSADTAFVEGYVKEISEMDITNNHNATYLLKDADADNELVVFRGKGMNGADFTATDQLAVGDRVIVKGKLQKYKDSNNNITPEVRSINYLVERQEKGNVASVAIGGTLSQTVYEAGDIISTDGLTATATYENGYHEDVTALASWTVDGYDEKIIYIAESEYAFGAAYGGKSDGTVIRVYANTYAVSFDAPEHGTLDIKYGGSAISSGDAFVKGTQLTVETAPANGYTDGSITVLKASDDSDITADVLSNGTLTIPTYAVKVVATFSEDIKPYFPMAWSKTSYTLTYGTSVDPSLYARLMIDESLKDKPVALTSSNTDVVTITGTNYEDGGFTINLDIKKPGIVDLTATYDADGTYQETVEVFKLTVNKADADLAWSANEATAYTIGKSYQLPALSNPNGLLSIDYSSSNTDVATIDDLGAITLHAAGTTTITAAFGGNDYYNETSVSYTLTVYAPVSVAISGSCETSYEVGDPFDRTGLVATVTYGDNSQLDVTNDAEWSGAPTNVTISEILTIQATYAGVSGSTQITVYTSNHLVTLGQTEHGSIALIYEGDPTSESEWTKGSELSVMVEPDAGYKLATLTAGGVDITNTKTFTVGTEDIEVVATFALIPVQVAGSMSGWTPIDFTLNGDGTASLSANINEGSYEFKMVIDGEQRGIDGENNTSYILTRENPSATGMVSDCNNNMILTVDYKGDYIFTWSFSDNSLTVTYPVIPTYAVTFAQPENGTLTIKENGVAINSGDQFVEGTELTVEAEPIDGYILSTLTAGGVDIKDTKTLVVGTENIEVVATFILDDPTGINRTEMENKAIKIIENNHLIIIKNGIRYNAIGVKIQ